MDPKKTDIIRNLHNLEFYKKKRLWTNKEVPVTPTLSKEDDTENAGNQQQLHFTESIDEDNAGASASNAMDVSHPNQSTFPDFSLDGHVNPGTDLSFTEMLAEASGFCRAEYDQDALREETASSETDYDTNGSDWGSDSTHQPIVLHSQEDTPRRPWLFFEDDGGSRASEEFGQSMAGALPPCYAPSEKTCEPSDKSYEPADKSYEVGLMGVGMQYKCEDLDRMYEQGPFNNQFRSQDLEMMNECGNTGNQSDNENLGKNDEQKILNKQSRKRRTYKLMCAQNYFDKINVLQFEDKSDDFSTFMRGAHAVPHSSMKNLDLADTLFKAENLTNHSLAAMSPLQLDYNLVLVSNAWTRMMNEKFKRLELNNSASSALQVEEPPAPAPAAKGRRGGRRNRRRRRAGPPKANVSV